MSERELEDIEEVRQAMRRSVACLPWEPRCLAQAVAARWMLYLRGIPSELTIGVKGSRFEAHAWLTAGGVPVSGDGVSSEFKAISTLR